MTLVLRVAHIRQTFVDGLENEIFEFSWTIAIVEAELSLARFCVETVTHGLVHFICGLVNLDTIEENVW
jgi:hypothetical protein